MYHYPYTSFLISTISKDNFKTNISEIQSNQSIFLLRKYI